MYIILTAPTCEKEATWECYYRDVCSTVWDPIFSIVGRASRGERKRDYQFLRKDCNKVGKRKRRIRAKRLSIVQPRFDLDGRE